MVKKSVLVFGIVLLAVGLLGFIPTLAPNGNLLGILAVNSYHNLFHIATGLSALGAWIAAGRAPKLFLRVLGVLYTAVAFLGFIQGDTALGLIAVNLAGNLLHLAIAAAALYGGFVAADRTVSSDTNRVAS